jgi:hypothetical protein
MRSAQMRAFGLTPAAKGHATTRTQQTNQEISAGPLDRHSQNQFEALGVVAATMFLLLTCITSTSAEGHFFLFKATVQ